MKKLFKKNESGRSMVEMLGVLAIIGVLSVGGIAGYRMAMKRIMYKQIDDFVQQLALVLVGEQYKDNADDLRCNEPNHSSYAPIHYLCNLVGSEYCKGSKVSYNGYYWLDHGKEGPFFGWEVSTRSDLSQNHYLYGVLVSFWFSDSDMCKHVMRNLGQNKDFTKMVKYFSVPIIGRGKDQNIIGYGSGASWTESRIDRVCSPLTSPYNGRDSIPVGLALNDSIETFECEYTDE